MAIPNVFVRAEVTADIPDIARAYGFTESEFLWLLAADFRKRSLSHFDGILKRLNIKPRPAGNIIPFPGREETE